MKYRLVCDLAPNWNKTPGNRFGKAEAERRLKDANAGCPGRHHLEEIKE
jgi:hypothetical protein